jgi:predicted kinase
MEQNLIQNEVQQQPIGVLFGILAYSSEEELEQYLSRLSQSSTNDVLLTIHSALRYALSKGVFSFQEAESVSIALRKIKDVSQIMDV